MERIKDLMNPEQTNLRIREGARGVWIEGANCWYWLELGFTAEESDKLIFSSLFVSLDRCYGTLC